MRFSLLYILTALAVHCVSGATTTKTSTKTTVTSTTSPKPSNCKVGPFRVAAYSNPNVADGTTLGLVLLGEGLPDPDPSNADWVTFRKDNVNSRPNRLCIDYSNHLINLATGRFAVVNTRTAGLNGDAMYLEYQRGIDQGYYQACTCSVSTSTVLACTCGPYSQFRIGSGGVFYVARSTAPANDPNAAKATLKVTYT